MKNIYGVLSVVILSASSVAAVAGGDAVTKPPTEATAVAEKTSTSAPMAEGEIKKIDKEAGKVTIKHGEIKNLDMPPMTMVFRIKDAAQLDTLKVGDKINFAADNINGKLTVTQVEVNGVK